VGAAENLSVHTPCTTDEDRHDLSHHGDYFHDDIVVYQPGAEPVVGIEAYRAFMGATYAGLQTSTSSSMTSSPRMTGLYAGGESTEHIAPIHLAFQRLGTLSNSPAYLCGSLRTERPVAVGSTLTCRQSWRNSAPRLMEER
jgi:hypothetical protein